MKKTKSEARSTGWPRVIQNGTAGPDACTVSRTLRSRSGKCKTVHTTGIDGNLIIGRSVIQAPSATPMPPPHHQSQADWTAAGDAYRSVEKGRQEWGGQ